MALDVRTGKTIQISAVTAEVWTTPVCAVISPAGATLASPAVTADATSTTVASAANAYTLTLADASGVVVGRSYLVTHAGATAVGTVDTVAGSEVTLTEALPWTPEAADTFEGVLLTATVPASATADRGTHYAVIFTDSADDNREARAVFHVVRRAFLPPLTPQDVRRLVTTRWPADVLQQEQYREVAETVHAEIRDELLASGHYAEAYIDPEPFKPAARVIARRVLAVSFGLFPGNRDPEEYLDSLNRERTQMIARVLSSIQPVDRDDDGVPDADDAVMMVVRRSR